MTLICEIYNFETANL